MDNTKPPDGSIPDTIRSRIENEFSSTDHARACQLLADYMSSSRECDVTPILDAILNQSGGQIDSLRTLIQTAEQDWRDLFYSSQNDPFHLIGRLLKNLRFTKTFSDDEIAEIKNESGGVLYEEQFNAILERIKSIDKTITTQQHVRIIEIGGLLGYPKHQFDWLSNFTDNNGLTQRRKPWWNLW